MYSILERNSTSETTPSAHQPDALFLIHEGILLLIYSINKMPRNYWDHV